MSSRGLTFDCVFIVYYYHKPFGFVHNVKDDINFVLIIDYRYIKSNTHTQKVLWGMLALHVVNQLHYSLLYGYLSVSIVDLFGVNIMSKEILILNFDSYKTEVLLLLSILLLIFLNLILKINEY